MPATLSPTGADTQLVADLIQWMAYGAAILWAAALGVLIYCLRTPLPGTAAASARPRRGFSAAGVTVRS